MLGLGIFFEDTPDGDTTWGMSLLSGLQYTLVLVVCAWIIAMALGSVLGVVRTTRHRFWVTLGNGYVELFRNIPLLVQFFLWYFVLPSVIAPLKRFANAVDPGTFQLLTAVVCLGLFTAARIAEQVKSGIQSLPRGQTLAGLALGLTPTQTYRHVLLPMAYRIIIPPLTSESMNLVKNSAVAYSIGLTELFFRTREMGEMTFRYFAAFGAATVLYVAVAFSINRIMAWVERATAVPGYMGGSK
ncbi:MAG: amino acid ABC transporter permease [Thiomonas sp.]|uniref:amino acid ABC transporter permease n=1 Tax=Thiomonas sp. TaxID=2047785 RepID=UPI002A36C56F|nr:amino acid ABC transporter permease [Thiomonas sp.]MDY0330493.1 amino acid ABC transporter permease [Thiomonas sp.]